MKLFSRQFIFALCTVALFSGIQSTEAQDQRYSQYYAAPARLNPALAGVFDGAFRMGVNYRAQWGANMNRGYNSASFTADGRTGVFANDYLGYGLNVMHDAAGVGGYAITEIGFDINYQKKLYQGRGYGGKDKKHFLIAGAHAGLGQRRVNWDRLTFSEQYDPESSSNGYYNTNINSGESEASRRDLRLYPEFHAGLLWWGTFGKRKSAYAGASIYHLNRPDISLFWRPPVDSLGNTFGTPIEKLPMRYAVHAGGEILVGGKGSAVSLLPGAVFMFQGPSTELNFGLLAKYQAPKYDDFGLKFGLWTRVANQFVSLDAATMGIDALVVHVGLDYNQFQFGFSYDATLSKLMSINNTRGSFEFSLFYIFPGDTKRQMGCPSFN
jgi:type IX secretion system PorP/SprF family membrane protein